MIKKDISYEELSNRLIDALAPSAQTLGLQVLDVNCTGDVLQVVLEDPAGPIDSSRIEAASSVISAALDILQIVDEVYPHSYVLEVSSPGLERILRRPEHYQRFVGAKVSLKLNANVVGERRLVGWILGANEQLVTIALDFPVAPVDVREIRMIDIFRARTVFEWASGEKKIDSGKRIK